MNMEQQRCITPVFQDHICIERLSNVWTSPASFSRDSPTAIKVAPNNHFSPMLHSVTSINKQFILQTADTIGLHYGWNKDRTCSIERECDLFYQGRYMWPVRSSLSGFITVSSEHRTKTTMLMCFEQNTQTSILCSISVDLGVWVNKSYCFLLY